MVLRSMLFVPGNNMRLIAKAATLACDAVILDLEDAVPLADKETARIMVADSVRAVKSGGSSVFIRVNALVTGLTAEDLRVACVEGVDGIMLAKTETGGDVAELAGMLEKVERNTGLNPDSLTIIPLIESARGLVNVAEITSASRKIAAVAFGAGDYYRDLGRNAAFLSPDQTELLYARCQIVNAGAAVGIQAVDTPFFGFLTDKEGFAREADMALRLGFKGKLLIHPAQIDIVNGIFSPSSGEVDYAQRVVEAFQEAERKGLGAISFEGKMIDIMNFRQAKELVDFMALISEREKTRRSAPAATLSGFFKTESGRRGKTVAPSSRARRARGG